MKRVAADVQIAFKKDKVYTVTGPAGNSRKGKFAERVTLEGKEYLIFSVRKAFPRQGKGK